MSDENPKLSLRVVAEEYEERDRIGRLYRRPDFVLPSDYRSKKVYRRLLNEGLLMPSITNVIDVRGKPYLTGWAAKITAEKAVEVWRKFPNLVFERPIQKAIDFLKLEPIRHRDHWGNQGGRIHKMAEELAQERPLPYTDLTEYERGSLDAWKAWLDTFQPVFHHLEVTGFGKTQHNLNYAGTGDAILSINGHAYAVDYKCVTPDTRILLSDGRSVRADQIRVGDRVVAWTPQRNLHGAPITMVEDNGDQLTVTITTALGNRLEVTENHPVLASRGKGKSGFAEARQLKTGDTVYLGAGWAYNPSQRDNQQAWPKDYALAPYLYGVLFTIAQHNKGEITSDSILKVPGTGRAQLRSELEAHGFTFTGDGDLILSAGLRSIARDKFPKGKDVAEPSEEELQAVIDSAVKLISIPSLSPFLHWVDDTSREGFFAGLREVFIRRDLDLDHFLITYGNAEITKDLHQLYLNSDIRAEFVEHAEMSYLMVPMKTAGEKTHGPVATQIVSIERSVEKKPTLAITVDASHTFITEGLITHNTNKSGLHVEVSQQLAAVRHFDEITPDSKTMLPMMETVGALGIHISPEGVSTVPVDTGEDVWETFEALRRVWNFHAFEGRHINPSGVLGKPVSSPKDL